MDLQVYMGEGVQTATELAIQRAAAARGQTTETGKGIDRESALYESCVDFEALFVKQMLSAMRKTVQKTGLLDGGVGQDIFEDMLYDEYAASMARSAGFGLADTVYLYLTSAQRAVVEAGTEQ